jgi:hypothetical protein
MQVFEAFLPELAKHLGRSKAKVRRTGILATEFPYQWVRVYCGDSKQSAHSICDFGFAFPIISAKQRAIAVFSQAAGYFVFHDANVVAVRGSQRAKRERIIWRPEDRKA